MLQTVSADYFLRYKNQEYAEVAACISEKVGASHPEFSYER
jgi:hypothetical protein